MVSTAPTMTSVSSFSNSAKTPTVMSTSCSSATMAPTAKANSKPIDT